MVAEPTHSRARHHFDHAAGSPLRPIARDAWLAAAEVVGNPAGLNGASRRSRSLLEDAREQIAADLRAHPTEVIVTSGGSEADTIAVWGSARWHADQSRADLAKDSVVISAVEHPAVSEITQHWPHVEIVDVDEHGRVRLDDLASKTDHRTGVVSVQTVNNEVGTIQPVDQAAEVAHAAGAWFHTDAVQALIAPGVDFAASAADLVSLSGHKIGAPVGVGILLARRGIEPHVTGLGGGQERQVRSGTQPTALLAGFAAALHETVASRDTEVARLSGLRERLLAGLSRKPDEGGLDGWRVNGGDARDGAGVNPAIVHLTTEGVRADDVLLLLDRFGIDASVGSACRAGLHQPSDVVLAMTGDEVAARSSLRFSMGWSTTMVDVDALVAALPEAVRRARD